MHFGIEQRFDAPLGRVEEALTDPAFLERLAELPRLGQPELLDQHSEGALVHRQVRYAFLGELSGAARAVVDPARLTWVEDSVIDLGRHRTVFRIVPDHYGHLLRCSGTFLLAPAASGCTRNAEGEVHVSVPLVGRKVEAAIVSGLREHAELESAAMARWLAGAA